MRTTGTPKIVKRKKKNKSKVKTLKALVKFENDIKIGYWASVEDLNLKRPYADIAHSDGYYFFNIDLDRALALVEFPSSVEIANKSIHDDDKGEVNIVWMGDHDEYLLNFNSKKKTEKWLRSHGYID